MKRSLLVLFLFGSILSVNGQAQIPTAGLVAHYPFSGNANDQSGNANNGTVYSGATLTTDRFGDTNSAYLFNGSSGYIQVANSTSLQSPSSAVTLSAWVYITDSTVLNWILDKRIQVPSAPYNSYGLFTAIGNNIHYGGVATNNGSKSTGKQKIILNTWMHLALVYNGSTIIHYVNGVPMDSATHTGNIQYSTQALYIGKSPNNAAYTKGKIDDIRIYNTSLSPDEILALRWEGVPCDLDITQHPADSATLVGQPAAFSVGATGSNIQYIWEVNDGSGFKPVNNCLYQEDSADLNILASLLHMDGYPFRCIVRNHICWDTSNEAVLWVDSAYYQTIYDTSWVMDTTLVWDTVNVMVYDTVQVNHYDTIPVNNYDTIPVYDTLPVYDTIPVMDTTFIIIYDTAYQVLFDSILVTDTLLIYTPVSFTPPVLSLIKVYPNPAKDHITIDVGNAAGMNNWSIVIVNSAGQTVYTTSVMQSAYTVDLATWTGNGLYYIRILDPVGNVIENRKIILQ